VHILVNYEPRLYRTSEVVPCQHVTRHCPLVPPFVEGDLCPIPVVPPLAKGDLAVFPDNKTDKLPDKTDKEEKDEMDEGDKSEINIELVYRRSHAWAKFSSLVKIKTCDPDVDWSAPAVYAELVEAYHELLIQPLSRPGQAAVSLLDGYGQSFKICSGLAIVGIFENQRCGKAVKEEGKGSVATSLTPTRSTEADTEVMDKKKSCLPQGTEKEDVEVGDSSSVSDIVIVARTPGTHVHIMDAYRDTRDVVSDDEASPCRLRVVSPVFPTIPTASFSDPLPVKSTLLGGADYSLMNSFGSSMNDHFASPHYLPGYFCPDEPRDAKDEQSAKDEPSEEKKSVMSQDTLTYEVRAYHDIASRGCALVVDVSPNACERSRIWHEADLNRDFCETECAMDDICNRRIPVIPEDLPAVMELLGRRYSPYKDERCTVLALMPRLKNNLKRESVAPRTFDTLLSLNLIEPRVRFVDHDLDDLVFSSSDLVLLKRHITKLVSRSSSLKKGSSSSSSLLLSLPSSYIMSVIFFQPVTLMYPRPLICLVWPPIRARQLAMPLLCTLRVLLFTGSRVHAVPVVLPPFFRVFMLVFILLFRVFLLFFQVLMSWRRGVARCAFC